MRKFFITGGTGFVGRNLVRCLQKYGKCYVLTRQSESVSEQCTYVKGNLDDGVRLDQLLALIRPTDLIHLAWDTTSDSYANNVANLQWIDKSRNLVQKFVHYGGKTVVGAGTCFEYYGGTDGVFDENISCYPKTLYGKAKLQTCKILRDICLEHNARFVWGRIFFAFGPGESERKLITTAIKTLKKGETFICKTPKNNIDYIHVDDVVGMFEYLTLNLEAEGVYNISTGRGVNIEDLVRYISLKTHSLGDIKNLPQENVLTLVGDNQKIIQLGYKLRYDVYQGVDTYF